MLNRRLFLTTLAATPLLARSALAESAGIYNEGGVAIGGADPVAYFTEGKPVIGSTDHAVTWDGVEWRFASEANRAAFEMDPARYAPEYGGYCAWAMAQGYLAQIDPEAWTIVEDRLYLNATLGVRERWSRDIPGNIAAADENWPDFL